VLSQSLIHSSFLEFRYSSMFFFNPWICCLNDMLILQIEQVILKSKEGLTGDVLERALYAIKRSFLGALRVHGLDWVQDNVYICSLSSRTIVYKGMVRYVANLFACLFTESLRIISLHAVYILSPMGGDLYLP
jgi:hypothetical protein